MTEEQRAELEKLAKAWLAINAHNPSKTGRECRAFQDAAGPEAVIDLLATIARLEAEKVKDGEALESIARQTGQYDAVEAWELQDIARACLSSRAKDQSQ